jgi:hypothetical protein
LRLGINGKNTAIISEEQYKNGCISQFLAYPISLRLQLGPSDRMLIHQVLRKAWTEKAIFL